MRSSCDRVELTKFGTQNRSGVMLHEKLYLRLLPLASLLSSCEQLNIRNALGLHPDFLNLLQSALNTPNSPNRHLPNPLIATHLILILKAAPTTRTRRTQERKRTKILGRLRRERTTTQKQRPQERSQRSLVGRKRRRLSARLSTFRVYICSFFLLLISYSSLQESTEGRVQESWPLVPLSYPCRNLDHRNCCPRVSAGWL